MDAVKIEGGFANRVKAVRAVVEAGVAVMGHVGLTPQAISVLGGFRPAAQSAGEALRVIKEAKALEAAGCFGLVLECVPELVAAAVTRELNIPTIGIGAGGATSGQARSLRAAAPWFVSPVGCHLPRASPSPPHPPHAQVLVYHDLLGMMQHPHHAKVTPKFCKQYASGARRVFPGSPRVPALSAQRARPPCSPAPHPSPRCACTLPAPPPPLAVGSVIQEALAAYHAEVGSKAFPSAQFSPYRIPPDEAGALLRDLEREGLDFAAEAVTLALAEQPV